MDIITELSKKECENAELKEEVKLLRLQVQQF